MTGSFCIDRFASAIDDFEATENKNIDAERIQLDLKEQNRDKEISVQSLRGEVAKLIVC